MKTNAMHDFDDFQVGLIVHNGYGLYVLVTDKSKNSFTVQVLNNKNNDANDVVVDAMSREDWEQNKNSDVRIIGTKENYPEYLL